MDKISFSYEGRSYQALQVTMSQLKQLIKGLPEALELEYIEEYSKVLARSVYELVGHGKEPLGLVQSYLQDTIKAGYNDLPQDMGYDTDADGIGYNGVLLVTS